MLPLVMLQERLAGSGWDQTPLCRHALQTPPLTPSFSLSLHSTSKYPIIDPLLLNMDRPKQNEPQVIKKKKRGRPTNASKAEAAAAPDFFLSASVAHTVGFGITGPPPQYSRVQVKSFAQVTQLIDREIRSHLSLCTQDFSGLDLEYVLLPSIWVLTVRKTLFHDRND